MSSTEGPIDVPGPSRPGCFICGRPTFDPDKRDRPWVRAMSRGRQVLVCPKCQAQRQDWATALDACEQCGATRLSAMLGRVVCRACGHETVLEDKPTGEPGA